MVKPSSYLRQEASRNATLRAKEFEIENTIVLPPTDMRRQRTGVLSANKLKYTVFTSNTSEQAIQLRVNAGSNSDPLNFPGTAHYVEHLAFLNNDTPDNTGAFKQFVASHNGYTNAVTHDTSTRYECQIYDTKQGKVENGEKPVIQQALNAFGQLFKSLSVSDEKAKRELTAVNEEFMLKKDKDSLKTSQVLKMALNKSHNIAQFGFGNHKSLSWAGNDKLNKTAKDFFKTHYHAQNMHVIVCGSAPVHELEKYVKESLSHIPRGQATNYNTKHTLLPQGFKSQYISSKSDVNFRMVNFWFQTPDSHIYKATKPDWIINKLIDTRGPGSLYETLVSKGLALNVLAIDSQHDGKNQLKAISISLTEKGEQQKEAVEDAVFSYINFMGRKLTPEYVSKTYEAGHKNAVADWKNGKLQGALKLVNTVSTNLGRYAYKDTLLGRYQIKPDIEATRQILKAMVPDKALIHYLLPEIASKPGDTVGLEPWLEIPFVASDVPQQNINRWADIQDAHFCLPAPNPFMQPDVTKVEVPLSQSNELSRVFKKDNIELWTSPAAGLNTSSSMRLLFAKPKHLTPLENAAFTLIEPAFSLQLNNIIFDASEAGIDINMNIDDHGIEVTLKGFGYTDKHKDVLEYVLSALKNLSMTDSQFHDFYLTVKDSINDYATEEVGKSIALEVNSVLNPSTPNLLTFKKVADQLTKQDFEQAAQFLKQVQVKALVRGNINKEQAKGVMDTLEKHLATPNVPALDIKPTTALQGQTIRHINTAEINFSKSLKGYHHYYQAAKATPVYQAAFDLITPMLKEPYFSDLRTDQEMGYSVSASSYNMKDKPGMSFIVLSDGKNTPDIHKATIEFIHKFRAKLDTMSPMGFEKHKANVLALDPDRKSQFDNETDEGQFWFQLMHAPLHDGSVQYESTVKDAIRSMSLDRLRSIFNECFIQKPNSLLVSLDPSAQNWGPKGYREV